MLSVLRNRSTKAARHLGFKVVGGLDSQQQRLHIAGQFSASAVQDLCNLTLGHLKAGAALTGLNGK